jgi:hypothetical protein
MDIFRRTTDLRGRFLLALYTLSGGQPGRTVGVDDIAAEMGVNLADPSSQDDVVDTAKYCEQRGYVTRQFAGYGAVSITAAGIDEVDRLLSEQRLTANPQTNPTDRSGGRADKRRRFLEAVYELAGGNPNQFVYWQNVAPRLGYDPESGEDLEEALGFADYFAGSGAIKIEADEGTMYRITARGIDEVEDNPASGFGVPAVQASSSSAESGRPEVAPLQIQDSLRRFRKDHPDPDAVAFILMQFGTTRAHEEITQAIKDVLAAHGITGVRADDKEYHDDLFPNVLTYMHGCKFGVAVFERIEGNALNPNVALEVGYMFAILKPVCLLKDRTLTSLNADLVGKLYREFDILAPAGTIGPQLSKWLSDKGLSAF